MKTARILVYHAYGTKSTVGTQVFYRGREVWSDMRNDTPQALANAAQDWARANGFTHWIVTYG